jgi:hypothetical protein
MGALSPDGKYVAYVTGQKGKESLWLRQVEINSNSLRIGSARGDISDSHSHLTAITSILVTLTPEATIPARYSGCRYSEATRTQCESNCRKDSPLYRMIANEWPLFVLIRTAQSDLLIIANADSSAEEGCRNSQMAAALWLGSSVAP